MSFSNVIELFRASLTFEANNDWVYDMVHSCSYIPFDEPNQLLFKKAERLPGFYWILKGQARCFYHSENPVFYPSGTMVGFEEFYSSKPHLVDVVSCDDSLETLFMDANSYKLFISHEGVMQQLLANLVNQCMQAKSRMPSSALKLSEN